MRWDAASAQTGGNINTSNNSAANGVSNSSNLALASARKRDSAKLMTDDVGDIVMGAGYNGIIKPVLIPDWFTMKYFVAQGENAKLDGSATALSNLSNFVTGGPWDIQRWGGKQDPRFTDASTIAIGLYGAAAGLPADKVLSIQNRFAQLFSHFDSATIYSKIYTNLPERNVENTYTGYRLYLSGAITSNGPYF